MKADVVINLVHLIVLDTRGESALVINIIAVGNDGVDAIVAARELDDDENLFTRLGLRVVNRLL